MRQLLIMLLMILVSGCVTSKTMEFKVVDGDTRQPLQGVRGTRDSQNAEIVFPIGRNETVELMPTDMDGMVTVRDIRSNQIHQLRFRKAGYSIAVANVGMDDEAGVLSPFVPGNAHEELLQVLPTAGVYIIPMYSNVNKAP